MLFFLSFIFSTHIMLNNIYIDFNKKSFIVNFTDNFCGHIDILVLYCFFIETISHSCPMNPSNASTISRAKYDSIILKNYCKEKSCKFTLSHATNNSLEIHIIDNNRTFECGFYYFVFEHFDKSSSKVMMILRLFVFLEGDMKKYNFKIFEIK